MLEKLRRKTRIRAEKQRNLSFDMTLIEMRYGHGRRSYRGFTVYLGVVTGGDLGIIAAKPDSAHREPGIAATLRNAGFDQQWQRPATGADKNEFGRNIAVRTAFFIPYPQTPSIPIAA